MRTVDFFVLSGSRGSTFQAIQDRLTDGTITAALLGLVTNDPHCGAAEKARVAKIPVIVVEPREGEGRLEYDQRLAEAITSACRTADGAVKPILACIGWFRILSPWFVQRFGNRILNVHPSLLPLYPGLSVHERVLAANEERSGMTIHLIDELLDHGRILLQRSCPVLPSDTPETLKARVQELEKEWYPVVLERIHRGEISLVGEKDEE